MIRYSGNIFCQPFVQYLDLSSPFNKTVSWALAHRARTAVGRDAGLHHAAEQPGSQSG